MVESAIGYFNDGQGCAQCLLAAAGEHEAARLCVCMARGFGFGGMCGAAVAGAMLAGAGRGELEARQAALSFLARFHELFGSLDCAALRRERGDCAGIITEAARLTDSAD